MPTQPLQFENAHGDTLHARMEQPVDGQPLAYALFAHCFTCSKDLRAARTISRALCANGFGVLRFDFTGLGESEGEFAETNFSSNVQDLVAAARFLDAQYDAPAVLVGHSLGGAAVLRAAEHIPSARAVATIGAPADPAHLTHLFEESVDEIEQTGGATVNLQGRPFRITQQFLEDVRAASLESALKTLGKALLVFHSPVDEVVGIENATRIFLAAKHPRSYVSLDRADHLLTDPQDASYVGTVLASWASKYLDASQAQSKSGDAEDNRVVTRTGRGGLHTEVLANGHALVADEPTSIPGGTNEGPTPYDYLGVALGACTSMTLRMYADRKEWPLEAAVVRVHHTKVHAKDCERCDTKEGKLDRFDREVDLIGDLDDDQRERLLEIASRCPVHRTLHSEVLVHTVLHDADAPPAPGDDAGSSSPPPASSPSSDDA